MCSNPPSQNGPAGNDPDGGGGAAVADNINDVKTGAGDGGGGGGGGAAEDVSLPGDRYTSCFFSVVCIEVQKRVSVTP